MEKQKMEMIAAGALLIVFIFLLSGTVKKVSGRPAAPRPIVSGAPAGASPVMPPAAPGARTAVSYSPFTAPVLAVPSHMVTAAAPASEKKEPEDGGWGRDPFVLHEVAVKVDSVENLRLMGITSGGNKKPMAVINNELVPVGAKIGKFEVIEISKKGVAVTDGKKIYTLKLE